MARLRGVLPVSPPQRPKWKRHVLPAPARRSLFWRSRRFWFAAVVVVVLGAGGVWRLLDQVDLPEEITNPLANTSLICGTSVPVGTCSIDNAAGQIFSGTESSPLAYDDIPMVVKQAVVASEDRKFFEHQGLDPFGIARGLYQNSKGGGSLQGGSTITQQYVKLAYLTNKRSLVRKVQESVLAIKLERSMTKQKILENYLNQAFYGRSATGIEAAARVYFDKPASSSQLRRRLFWWGWCETRLGPNPPNIKRQRFRCAIRCSRPWWRRGICPRPTTNGKRSCWW